MKTPQRRVVKNSSSRRKVLVENPIAPTQALDDDIPILNQSKLLDVFLSTFEGLAFEPIYRIRHAVLLILARINFGAMPGAIVSTNWPSFSGSPVKSSRRSMGANIKMGFSISLDSVLSLVTASCFFLVILPRVRACSFDFLTCFLGSLLSSSWLVAVP